MKDFVTDEMIEAFASREWTMQDFCMTYDCSPQVFWQLDNRSPTDASDLISPNMFISGFIHDEMHGDILGFRSKSMEIADCKEGFYKRGANMGGFLNDVAIRNIYRLLWESGTCTEKLHELYFVKMFSTAKLFGRNMGEGFTALRYANAPQELIEKGKSLAAVQYTIGNVMPLPRVLFEYWRDSHLERFDLFFKEMMSVISGNDMGNSQLTRICGEIAWFFKGGERGFLDRQFLTEFETDMGLAYGMHEFNKNDCRTDPQAYLTDANQYIDAALNVITRRTEQLIERIRLHLAN